MQRNYSLEVFHGQYYGTTGVAMAIYIDSLPRYILMIPLHGSFCFPAPQNERSKFEEGMGKQKLNKCQSERRWESNSVEAKSVSDVASKRCEGVSPYGNNGLSNCTI